MSQWLYFALPDKVGSKNLQRRVGDCLCTVCHENPRAAVTMRRGNRIPKKVFFATLAKYSFQNSEEGGAGGGGQPYFEMLKKFIANGLCNAH